MCPEPLWPLNASCLWAYEVAFKFYSHTRNNPNVPPLARLTEPYIVHITVGWTPFRRVQRTVGGCLVEAFQAISLEFRAPRWNDLLTSPSPAGVAAPLLKQSSTCCFILTVGYGVKVITRLVIFTDIHHPRAGTDHTERRSDFHTFEWLRSVQKWMGKWLKLMLMLRETRGVPWLTVNSS